MGYMKFLMNIFLSFSLLFLLTLEGAAQAKDLKFAQVTDVNYKKNSEALVKIIKDINKTPEIDFVVFSGNNLGRAYSDNLKNFLADAKKLNVPYYVILGNKDVSKSNRLDKKTYFKMLCKANKFHPRTPNYTFKKNGIVFIAVDGSKEVIPSANGVYSQETIAWVDEQLTKYKSNKAVILQHFPLANKPPSELYYTYNAQEYLAMLSKHSNVIAVIAGHFRKNDEITYNGIRHIITPQASNGIYKIIDIDESYEVFTMLRDIKE